MRYLAGVAVMLPNVPAMVEAHFAVPMAGAVLNALNIRLDATAIAFQLEHGGAKIILVDPEFSAVVADALKLMRGPKPLVIDVGAQIAQHLRLLRTMKLGVLRYLLYPMRLDSKYRAHMNGTYR